MKRLFIILILLLLYFSSFSQNYTISGYVEDATSGEKLISAYVFDKYSGKGTVTNSYGFYSLTLPKDSVRLISSYLGYSPVEKQFFLNKNMNINFELPVANELKEIEITGERVEKIEERSQMSQVEVPIKQIKSLPALFGEVDVLKTLQLLPGVQSGTEGTSGLYVRGGSPDQNLVLLDNVPVYNVSHFLGIFSVFNADALKNVNITKGGFPARYGGRLSSIIDINMKDGNMKSYHGAGSIGNITSKLMIEGPIVKNQGSFIVSGRRTYADLFLKPLIHKAASREGEKADLDLYFYDLNAKANYIINNKNRLYFSFYSGNDVFGYSGESTYEENVSSNSFGINWGNTIMALRWNNQINSKLFANTTLTFSNFKTLFFAEYKDKYLNENDTINDNFLAKYSSGIKDYAAKIDFDYIPFPNHYIKFGIGYIKHKYNPGVINMKFEENNNKLDTTLGYNISYSDELDTYIEDDFTFGQLKANIGLHFSGFKTGSAFYNSLQPRLGIRYLLSNGIAIKGSYATMKQYINLLTSESLSTPLDLWVPSTEKIKPQYSWQSALGFAKTIKKEYELSLEGYYKEMKNVISYRPGSSFLGEGPGETNWEKKVVQGNGQSYGLELLLQKKKGKLSGWIAYTLSWNWRQFDEINGGEKYPFRYDRRHDFAIVGMYKYSKKITMSASWIYSTGNAVSIPVYKYPIGQYKNNNPFDYIEVESLGSKNSFRMSDSHRLDISVEFHKKKKKWERAWVIGVYNTYFHKNPFFLITDYDYKKDKNVFKEVSLLPFLPFVSYQFKF